MRNPYRAPGFPKPAILEEPAVFHVRDRTVWEDIADSAGRELDYQIARIAGHAEGCRYPTYGCDCIMAANWYGWEHPLTSLKGDNQSWLDQYVS